MCEFRFLIVVASTASTATATAAAAGAFPIRSSPSCWQVLRVIFTVRLTTDDDQNEWEMIEKLIKMKQPETIKPHAHTLLLCNVNPIYLLGVLHLNEIHLLPKTKHNTHTQLISSIARPFVQIGTPPIL